MSEYAHKHVCVCVAAGVTRDSIIQLARRLGYEVHEEPVSVHEAMEADEVFTTGQSMVFDQQCGQQACSFHSLFSSAMKRQHMWLAYSCSINCETVGVH
jgi:hypothetical protein